ncbi:MAG TPA: hypothetical protein PKD95_04790 [Candidatus Paceibacterota bacterium]|nr:hypothetical protein [Candidatus Paceibacterota bacterium]
MQPLSRARDPKGSGRLSGLRGAFFLPPTKRLALLSKRPPALGPVALVHSSRVNDLPAMQAAGGYLILSGNTFAVTIYLPSVLEPFCV